MEGCGAIFVVTAGIVGIGDLEIGLPSAGFSSLIGVVILLTFCSLEGNFTGIWVAGELDFGTALGGGIGCGTGCDGGCAGGRWVPSACWADRADTRLGSRE